MHVPLTLAALAALTATIVLVRIFWPRLAPGIRHILIACACLALTAQTLCAASPWAPTSDRLHALVRWSGFAGYEFFLILFTLWPPRWLTSLIAAVLILPILSSSTLLPLSILFDDFPKTTIPLADNIVSVRTFIDRSSIATNAADIGVYYRPHWLPFLQRSLAETRFFDTQCNADSSFATLQPNQKSVIFTCPALPPQPSTAAVIERHPVH
jgi:hypothetical protein